MSSSQSRGRFVPPTGLKRAGLMLAVAVAASAVVASLTGPLESLEMDGFDRLAAGAAPVPLPDEIVLVDLDDAAMAAWGYPIPRSRIAALVRRIAEGEPDLIGLDILLSESRGPEADEVMAAALADAGNVIIARNFGSLDLTEAEPLPVFAEAALDTAFVNFPVDADGLIRRTFLVVRTETSAGLSLPAALASNHLLVPIRPGGPRALTLGERTLPLDGTPLGTALVGAWHVRPDPAVLPATAVLEPGFDPGAFAGRIVLVGQSNSAAKDLYPTPAFRRQGSGLFPGAEIHAATLSAILNGRLVSVLDGEARWILLFTVTLLAAAAGGLLGSTAGMLATLGIGSLVYLLAVQLYARQMWLPFVSVELGAALAFVLALGVRVWEERRRREQVDAEKAQVLALFSRYVSPEVVEQIWQDRGVEILTGHECEVTVMFSDIRSFTSLTQGQPSAQVLRWLNEYFTEMSGVIKANGGFLNKFIGDGLMVVFGAPLSTSPEDDACRAVKTALEMQECVARLNAEPSGYRPHLKIGVGLHTGPVTAGNVGASDRMEYSVVGETVNVASRLESLTKEFKTDLLMTERTKRLVEGRFVTRELGDTAVRGLIGRTAVYTVEGRHPPEEEP